VQPIAEVGDYLHVVLDAKEISVTDRPARGPLLRTMHFTGYALASARRVRR